MQHHLPGSQPRFGGHGYRLLQGSRPGHSAQASPPRPHAGHRCPQQGEGLAGCADARDRHVPDPGRSLRQLRGGRRTRVRTGCDRGVPRPLQPKRQDQGHLPAMVQIHRLQDGQWPAGCLPRPGALEGKLRHPERQDRVPQRNVAQAALCPARQVHRGAGATQGLAGDR